MKHLYLLAPFFSVILLFCVYFLIQNNRKNIPEPLIQEQNEPEQLWDSEEYLRHLKSKPFNTAEVHRLLLKITKQKQGVYLESLNSALDTAGIEIVNIYHQVLGDDYTPVITSGNDWPYHAKNSKHYFNKALDFRIKYIPFEKKKEIVERIEKKLSPRFKIIWERGEAEHLHIELAE